MDYDAPTKNLTRAEDTAHWKRYRRNATIGYVVLALGFGLGGWIQATGQRNNCEQLNRTNVTVAAALQQQKKLSQEKYEAGQTTKAAWLQQQAALDKAIDGLKPLDCTGVSLT